MSQLIPAITLLIILVLSSACAGGRPSSTPDAQETETIQTVLELWIPENGNEFFPRLVHAYEREDPTTNIEIIEIPSRDYQERVRAALEEGTGPDIAMVPGWRWIKAGYFLPLNDAIEIYEVPLDDLNQPALQATCLFEGRYYCLGTQTRATLLFYNKDLFDKAGVPYPGTDGTLTIREYHDKALALSRPGEDIEQRIWGGEAGPYYEWADPRTHFSEDGKTIEGFLNDRATIAAYQVMADLQKSGAAISPEEVNELKQGSLERFLQGRQAMIIGDSSLLFAAQEQGLRWGVTWVPVEKKEDPKWTRIWTDGFGVVAASQHQEEAARFVAFLGARGSALRLEFDHLPLNIRLAEAWAEKDADRQPVYQAIRRPGERLFIPDYEEIARPIWQAWGRMITDNASAADALNEVIPGMQATLDQVWPAYAPEPTPTP